MNNQQISELKAFFSSHKPGPMRLNKHTYIRDMDLFLSSHLASIEADNASSKPCLDRLIELKNLLENEHD